MDQIKITTTKNTRSSPYVSMNSKSLDDQGFNELTEKKNRFIRLNEVMRQHMKDLQNEIQTEIDQKSINSKNQITDHDIAINRTDADTNIDYTNWTPTMRSFASILPIGDVSLEQVYATLNQQLPGEFITYVLSTNRYKKDFFVIDFNESYSDVVKYGVFALFFNGTTYVLTTTYKRNMDLVLIQYNESVSDPTDIVETTYRYQKQIARSLYLKSVMRRENNPERLEDLSVVQISTKPISHMFNNLIGVSDIDPEIINLNVIIKNETYISTTEFSKLDAVVSVMMMF